MRAGSWFSSFWGVGVMYLGSGDYLLGSGKSCSFGCLGGESCYGSCSFKMKSMWIVECGQCHDFRGSGEWELCIWGVEITSWGLGNHVLLFVWVRKAAMEHAVLKCKIMWLVEHGMGLDFRGSGEWDLFIRGVEITSWGVWIQVLVLVWVRKAAMEHAVFKWKSCDL